MNRRVLRTIHFLPNHRRDEVLLPKDFIHHVTQRLHLVVVDADEDRPVLAQKLPQQRQPWIHHAQPAVVPVQRFAFLADHLAEPFADDRARHVIVVRPAFVAGVVRRVNVDALHLPGVERQQRLQRYQVVTLHDEIAVARSAAGKLGHVLEQVEGHLPVMVHHRFLAYPVQRRHSLFFVAGMVRQPKRRESHEAGAQVKPPASGLLAKTRKALRFSRSKLKSQWRHGAVLSTFAASAATIA